MNDDDTTGAYFLPSANLHPAIIADRVLRMPEHRNLVDCEAKIEWLMRASPKVKAGRQILGTAYMPRVNGELSDMFDWMLEKMFGEMPDFLIVLDAEFWLNATDHQREILVFHELSHCVQAEDNYGSPKFNRDGEPVFAIKGHDVEEFTQVVARYGAYSDDIRAFIAAAEQA